MKKVFFPKSAARAVAAFVDREDTRKLVTGSAVDTALKAASQQVRNLAEERRRVRQIDQEVMAQRVSV